MRSFSQPPSNRKCQSSARTSANVGSGRTAPADGLGENRGGDPCNGYARSVYWVQGGAAAPRAAAHCPSDRFLCAVLPGYAAGGTSGYKGGCSGWLRQPPGVRHLLGHSPLLGFRCSLLNRSLRLRHVSPCAILVALAIVLYPSLFAPKSRMNGILSMMDNFSLRRRDVIVGAMATSAMLLAPQFSRAQALLPARLLVVRKPGFSLSNDCIAPCIRGKIYDVSSLGDYSLESVSLPVLGAPICDTIERPWRNNRPNVSSIPVGKYSAVFRDDATKSWMNTLNKRWRIEPEGVPHRSNIQFHYGNDVDWSEGCFIVGDLIQPDGSTGMETTYCSVSGGEAAVERLREAVSAPGLDTSALEIGVTNDYGVFPDFSTDANC